MPKNEKMTGDEKRCLAVANKYLSESMSEQTRSSSFNMVGALGIAASGEMLGQIAADKFRSCMRAATQAAPRRATATPRH